MKKPKLRELKEAITALLKGPSTSKYPFAPSIPPKGYRGKAEYYNEGCVGCNACYEICPSGAIESTLISKDDKLFKRLVLHYDMCNFCGQCQKNCITQEGIKLTQEYDLANFDRTKVFACVEKEMLVCECCQEPVMALEHLKYLAKKLGILTYASPRLILTSQKEIKVIEEEITGKQTERFARADMYRILCPKCRRQFWLTDEYGK